jgi:methylated-DNA-[protein]-cysteine S-methyltransferase
MKCFAKKISTPVGDMLLAAGEEAIVALVWNKSELKRIGLEASAESDSPLLRKAEKQLAEYFSGKRKSFDLPLSLNGTAFQKSVWEALRKIPFGKTWSYQELARRVGSPRAVRAVGSANGKNPVCILIPCHRVVRLSGEIGGYAGGVRNKEILLELERRAPE